MRHGFTFTLSLVLICTLAACGQKIDLTAVESARLSPLHRYDIVQALVSNGETVVGASQAGAVVVSVDQAKTWQRKELGLASITSMTACPNGEFVGIDFNRKVWFADKKGANWASAKLDQPRTPLAVTCDAKGRWWVVGSRAKIAMSDDHGATWIVTDLQEDVQFTTISFTDENHAVVLGEFGSVVTTEDGGSTWKKLAPIAGEFYPYAALFRDRNEGWASGIAGQMLHTTDGARTWVRMENRANAPLYRLFMHGDQPYGVGGGGIVARLDQGVWQALPYADAAPVFLGAGTSLGEAQAALVVGGPGGLTRIISTQPAAVKLAASKLAASNAGAGT